MFDNTEEDRSDLLLSGAVYVFGPSVFIILFGRVLGIQALPLAPEILSVTLPLVLTVLVPLLLMRYRRERLAGFGVDGSLPGLGVGALLALPVAAGAVVGLAATGQAFTAAFAALTGPPGWLVAARLVRWIGLAGLAVYATIKARNAFRSDSRNLREAATEIGGVVALLVAITAGLVAILDQPAIELLTVPLGVALALVVAVRSAPDNAVTSRAVLVTPTVVLALSTLAFMGLMLVQVPFLGRLWMGAVLAGVGLTFGVLLETRRSAMPVFGLGLVLAVLTGL